MINSKQHTILLIGIDEEVRPDLANALEVAGSRVYWLDVPFVVPTDGSGVVSTENLTRLTEELERKCQEIGHIDVLVNGVSFDAQNATAPCSPFTAIHTAALMQFSRPIRAVLPGMIIRQKGHLIALVAGGTDLISAEAYNAASSAAATISHRVNEAVNGDNIKSDVLFNRGSYNDAHKEGLIDILVNLGTV